MSTSTAKRRKGRKAKPPVIPRTHKPADMSLEDWQRALRRQFAQQQKYQVRAVDDQPVFGDRLVSNPQSGRTYRVAIRGGHCGDNHCSCPDFAVNTLGTCKHIEFVLSKLERGRASRKILAAGFHPAFSEFYLRYGTRREVALRRGTDCPADLDERIGKHLGAGDIVKPESFVHFERLVDEARKGGHEVRCGEDALQFVAQHRDRAALSKRIDALLKGGKEQRLFKGALKSPLYPYQQEGALFLARAGRAMLADEMGLGKSIQAMAAAELLARAGGVERVLIIAPTSLKHQWKQEIERFTHRSAVVVQGGPKQRAEAYQSDAFYKIVNYDVLHLDLRHIENLKADLVILDEAQRIKNWKTRAAQTVKRLDTQHAFVLTGTPLENRLEELHSLVEFVDRFRLGPLFRFLHEHQQLDEVGKVVGYCNLNGISKTLNPLLLRRTKDQVLKDLPPRLEKHLFIPMTPQQHELHQLNQETVARVVAKWRKHKFLSEADQRRLTCALQNMRMSCNSTYLLDPQTEFGDKPDELVAQMREILEDRDAKVVVFSQWVRSHELLMRRLKRDDIGHVMFHGGVPGHKRRDLVDRFKQESDCRVFLSTDAGGVGLNLQNACAVLNMDLPWNPAVLEQRIGRVHRLGQARPVHVVHFVAEGTIEHGMLNLLRFKKSLFAGALDGEQDEVFLGGTRLKRFMDSVESASSAVPDIPPLSPEEAVDIVAAPSQQEDDSVTESISTPVAPVVDDVWGPLLDAGRALLAGVTGALSASGSGESPNKPPASGPIRIERDPHTGTRSLKLALPSDEVLAKAVPLLKALGEMLSGR